MCCRTQTRLLLSTFLPRANSLGGQGEGANKTTKAHQLMKPVLDQQLSLVEKIRNKLARRLWSWVQKYSLKIIIFEGKGNH